MPVSRLFKDHVSTARGVNLTIEQKPIKITVAGVNNETDPFIVGSKVRNIHDFASILEFLCLNKQEYEPMLTHLKPNGYKSF